MTFEEYQQIPNKEWWQITYLGYWDAGAASRDAEVVSLTNQRDYEYVRAENAEQERDQLREQVMMLRKGFTEIMTNTCEKFPGQRMLQIESICQEALAATESK